MSEIETNDLACEFEEKHGSIALIKICNGALNQLLIKKGLITEDELKASFLDILKEAEGVFDEM